MGLRQREWARRTTEKLRSILGGKCARCGTTDELEFDCIMPRTNGHGRKYDWSWRLSFYRAQYKDGNLQLLCSWCNKTKSDSEPRLVECLIGLRIENYAATQFPPTIERMQD